MTFNRETRMTCSPSQGTIRQTQALSRPPLPRQYLPVEWTRVSVSATTHNAGQHNLRGVALLQIEENEFIPWWSYQRPSRLLSDFSRWRWKFDQDFWVLYQPGGHELQRTSWFVQVHKAIWKLEVGGFRCKNWVYTEEFIIISRQMPGFKRFEKLSLYKLGRPVSMFPSPFSYLV